MLFFFSFQVDLLDIFFNQCVLTFYVQRTSCFSLFACWFNDWTLHVWAVSFHTLSFDLFRLLLMNLSLSLSLSRLTWKIHVNGYFILCAFILILLLLLLFHFKFPFIGLEKKKITQTTFVCDDVHYILHYIKWNFWPVPFLIFIFLRKIVFIAASLNVSVNVWCWSHDWFGIKT